MKAYNYSREAWVKVGFYLGCSMVAGFMLWQWGTVSLPEAHTITTRILALGRLAGLVATFGVLLQLMFMSRLPYLERALGTDSLLKLHRYNGYVIFYALLAHPILLTAGYQVGSRPGLWAQFVDFVVNYPDVWRALVGMLMLIAVVAMSIVMVRSRLPYEFWYLIHLTVYIAILLSFGHQLKTGRDFVGHPWFVAYWYVLYIGVFAVVGWFRFVIPLWRLWDQRFVVTRVVAEADNIHSIYVQGRKLDQFQILPGQFLSWRFLSRELWWQSHPFSVSMAPDGKQLRLTCKTVGDFTAVLPKVKPGTPVFIDGPHGSFTLDLAHGTRLLYIAGGIGITPLLSMLESLRPGQRDVVLIYSCRNQEERVFTAELAVLQKRIGLTVHYVVSDQVGQLNPEMIRQFVPDVDKREVFLCGPLPMMEAVTGMLAGLGVAKADIYTERFTL